MFVAMLAAHAALFLLLTLALRPRTTLTRTEFAVAPVYLADLRKRPPPKREREAPPQAAAAPITPPVLSRPAEAAGPAALAVPATAPTDAAADGQTQQLARALRGSRVGCANPDLLSEAEQLRCQDQLEAGSKMAKYIPTPLPAARRAYYDAIIKEKAPTPNSAIVPSAGSRGGLAGGPGMFAAAGGNATRGMGGRTPGLGCKFAFGGPKGTGGWKKPPNSIGLGSLPCAILLPTLSADANIQNPDKVIRDPKKVEDR